MDRVAAVVLAAAISVAILAFLALVVRREPLPRSIDEAALGPLWAQMFLLGLVVVGWLLAGPAFARRTP